jgi:ABC-type glucose/galactose transport system permease subunit
MIRQKQRFSTQDIVYLILTVLITVGMIWVIWNNPFSG